MTLTKYMQLCVCTFALIILLAVDSNSHDKKFANISEKDKSDFVNHVVDCYDWYYKFESKNSEFVLPVELVVAVAIHESNYGTSRFAVEGYNYYGIRTSSDDPDEYMVPAQAPDVKVAKYLHNCNSVWAFIKLISYSSHYSDAVDMIKENPNNIDYKKVLKSINEKYSTSENWPGRVAHIISELDLR
jgi:uncharacterized FlgJ-related protein